MRIRTLALLGALAVTASACEGPLDVDPAAQIPFDEALNTAQKVSAAVNGMYDQLQSEGAFARNHLVYPDLYADNLAFTGTFGTDREVSLRNVRPDNASLAGMWGTWYGGINRANNILDAIPNVDGLTNFEATRFRGEALFIRAHNYFSLVRWWGGVPLTLEPRWETDPDVVQLARSTSAQVYARIEADLEEAESLLAAASPIGRVDAVGRANVWVVRALLARVYLEQGKHAQARDMADLVIQSGRHATGPALELVPNYTMLFDVKNTLESIMEVQFTKDDGNNLAFWFFHRDVGGRRGFAPSTSLANSFPAGDARRPRTIQVAGGQMYGFKYHRIVTNDDNVHLLRLAEMYMIRAEANARLGADPADVAADINALRSRAGIADVDLTGATQDEMLLAVLAERRREFALEGHRFFDLRRMVDVPAVANYLFVVLSPALTPERLLFPIPQREMEVNHLLAQNPGY